MRRIELRRDEVQSFDDYPFNLSCVRALDKLVLDRYVTIFVGENGSGKSTLIEAIAVAIGLNPEGGSKNFQFQSRSTESELGGLLRIMRGPEREKDAFFMRAESVYTMSTEIERLEEIQPGFFHWYGGQSLHTRSHGEAFLALVANRFWGEGVYILDEPESALSPSRQIALLSVLWELTRNKSSQIVMATHSPILMAFPGAKIVQLTADGMEVVEFEQTEHFRLTKDFLNDRGAFLRHITPKRES